ncbi:hypothetical protein CHS0354_032676 [Potamilus streckersoni]|uniref:TIR domain-containing protein n=1 Tax=Potamilus streckersoni TaxID=2493646 RepID=A0AAE0SIF3_9BIVA|nr:hypothetical protein CHS0354_032676 [Potamilus streckersoni]
MDCSINIKRSTIWLHCDLLKVADVTPLADDSSRHFYSGVLCLPGQRLLLVDFSLNNVKLYNRQTGEILGKSEELYPLWDICCIDENKSKVAVTLRNGKIQIMSIIAIGPSPYIKSLKELKTPLESCRGVSAIPKQDKLVVSGVYRSMQCWCVVSVSDEQFGKIHKICQFGGFGYSYLVSSENGSYVYISCYADKPSDTGVYGYIMESGKHIFKYQRKDLSWPRGICADKKGFVYVCNQDLDSRNIHQLTGNGELVMIFRLDLLPDPQGMCLDENQEHIFITLWGKNQISRFRIMWQDNTEISQAHEVYGSNGSKQPAHDGETPIQKDKMTEMTDPAVQIYSCASDLTKPNEFQASSQKRTLPPGKKYHIFFSYSRLDIEWVRETICTLETDYGFICCDYDRDNTPGTSLLQFVSDSINMSYKIVIVMTRAAVQSPFVVHEIEMAMLDGFNKRKKFVVPVLLEDCEVLSYLRVLHYIDARDSMRRDIWWPKLLMVLDAPIL